MADLVEVVDGLLPLLEPTSALRNDTADRPFEHATGITYLYPRGDDVHEPSEFDHDIERFVLSADYVLASTERTAKTAQRAISTALDDRAHAMATVVRANREGPTVGDSALWHDLRCVIRHNDIRTNRTRGFRVEIRGWRHIGPS